jgi:hypothetical protein
MAPVLAAGGNATTLLSTGAYEVGGVAGVAATGAVVVAGGVAAIVRRRRTVRRNLAARANNRTAGSGALPGGRSGGTSRTPGTGFLSPAGRGSGGATSPRKNKGTDSAYRPGPGSGGGSSLLPGRRPGAKPTAPGGTSPAPTRGRTSGTATTNTAGRHARPTLAAAVGRTLRAQATPGSTPRRALAAIGRGSLTAARTTGRGMRAAATADRTRAAARAVRTGARRLRGAAVDGVRAVLAGTWAALRRRSLRAAFSRVRSSWEASRQRRADRAAEQATRTTPETETPEVATTVRRPTATTTPASTGGTTTMPGHHFVAPAMEMARIAAAYDPQGMLQVGEDFAGLEEALRLTAEAMKVTVENADAKQPLAPQIIEIMRNIHSLQLKAAEMATELRPAFEQLHAVDLERLRNPRKGVAGERMWDITTNLY